MLQQTVNGLAVGATYALLGLGVTLMWGVLKVLNFAYGIFITVGAFTTLLAIQAGLPAALAVLAGMCAGALLAVAVELLVIGPMRRRGAEEFSIVVATIGVSFLALTVVQALSDSQVRAFPIEAFPRGSVEVGSVSIPRLQLLTLVISVAVMLALTGWIGRTQSGRALRSVSYSASTAELLGVDSRRVFLIATAVAGALAGVAGTFVSAVTSTLAYDSGDHLLVVAFAVVVLGGLGSVKGAVVGGLLFGLIEVYATAYVSSTFSQTVSYVVILAILLLRPSGLFGVPEEARV